MLRVLIAAVIGGVVMFAWGFVAHMVLPIAEWGISEIPASGEEEILATMKKSMPEAGLYFFPARGMPKDMNSDAMTEWWKAHQSEPTGLMAYRPTGDTEMMPPSMLMKEFGTNALACLVAALVLCAVPRSVPFIGRVMIVGMMGLYGALEIEASYWTWYGFPAKYLAGQMLTAVGGGLAAGLVIAAIVRPCCAAGPDCSHA